MLCFDFDIFVLFVDRIFRGECMYNYGPKAFISVRYYYCVNFCRNVYHSTCPLYQDVAHFTVCYTRTMNKSARSVVSLVSTLYSRVCV